MVDFEFKDVLVYKVELVVIVCVFRSGDVVNGVFVLVKVELVK